MIRLVLAICVVWAAAEQFFTCLNRRWTAGLNSSQSAKEISIAKERANILEAEWAYVTRPDRILTLSSGLLLMRPITSDRILPLEAIPCGVPNRKQILGQGNERPFVLQPRQSCSQTIFFSSLWSLIWPAQPLPEQSRTTAQKRLIFARPCLFLFCSHRRKAFISPPLQKTRIQKFMLD